MQTAQFKAGDRVAYSAKHLRAFGALTGELPAMRGTVVDVKSDPRFPTLYVVRWDGADELVSAMGFALALVGPNRRFAYCD